MENGGELTVPTPFGPAKRCRAMSKGSGVRCGKAARRGAEVCAAHGVGYGCRVRDGRRTDPRLAQFRTGLRARPATLEVLGEVDPRFAQARAEYLAHPEELFDPTGVLADLHALRRLAAERVELFRDERGIQHAPPLLDIANAIVAAQERAQRVRRGLEVVNHVHIALVAGLIRNMVQILTKYAAPEDVALALDELKEAQAALTAPPAAS
jgi:hypothetical protein